MKFLFILSLFVFQAQVTHAFQEDDDKRVKAFIHESISQFETNEQGQIVVDKETLIAIENLVDKYQITEKEFEKFIFTLVKDVNISANHFVFLKDRDFNFKMSDRDKIIISSLAGVTIGMITTIIKAASLYIVANALVPIALGAAVGTVVIAIPTGFIIFFKHQSNEQAIEYLLNNDLVDNQTLIP